MIELLTGENNYELTRAVATRISSSDVEPERIDGSRLEARQMPDIFSGQTLFSMKRLIIISDLSTNSEGWSLLPKWANTMSDDTSVLLVETKPDKRTATYKWLKKNASVTEFVPWTIRDQRMAYEWARNEAERRGFSLSDKQARTVVERVGLDQWELSHALDKLGLLSAITDERIQELFEPRIEENVFELFETALRSDMAGITHMISTLRLSEEAYRVFGLLSGQAFQLAALTYARDNQDRNVASDFGVSPYALNKLRPYAARMQPNRLASIIDTFAKSDERLKTSPVDPWLVVEQSLLVVAKES